MDALPDYINPVIDPETGLIDITWYSYLKQLDAAVRALQAGS